VLQVIASTSRVRAGRAIRTLLARRTAKKPGAYGLLSRTRSGHARSSGYLSPNLLPVSRCIPFPGVKAPPGRRVATPAGRWLKTPAEPVQRHPGIRGYPQEPDRALGPRQRLLRPPGRAPGFSGPRPALLALLRFRGTEVRTSPNIGHRPTAGTPEKLLLLLGRQLAHQEIQAARLRFAQLRRGILLLRGQRYQSQAVRVFLGLPAPIQRNGPGRPIYRRNRDACNL
jgi:hypothetical protein